MKIANVEITHPDKVLYPKSGITKLDIAHYYEKIAPFMLPYLKDRLVSLVRAPENVENFKFYQKHPSESFPEYIQRCKVQEKDGTGIYITLDELNDILYLVNLGVLEFHTWGSKITDLEHPDILIFDLDPDPKAPFAYLVDAVLEIKKILDKSNMTSFVKTSGGKGYHIMIPIKPAYTWDEAKSFTRKIAESLVDLNPAKFTLEMKKADREGKVFLDYMRNTRGATNVCVFSTRAYNNAPISVPISWDDVGKVRPDGVSISDLFVTEGEDNYPRLRERFEVWEKYLKIKNTLPI